MLCTASRLLRSWRHIDWINIKICIHGASWMEQRRGKCWKSPIFEGNLRIFISYLSKIRIVSMFYNCVFLILALFTACFYHFLFWRYWNSSMTRFSSDILLPFPDSNDLNSRDIELDISIFCYKFWLKLKTFMFLILLNLIFLHSAMNSNMR